MRHRSASQASSRRASLHLQNGITFHPAGCLHLYFHARDLLIIRNFITHACSPSLMIYMTYVCTLPILVMSLCSMLVY